MRKFVLDIKCDNDAFQPDARPEIVRILRDIADKMETAKRPFGLQLYLMSMATTLVVSNSCKLIRSDRNEYRMVGKNY